MTETNLTSGSKCLPSDDVVAREIDGEVIIVPLVAGIGDADDEIYTLNPTGQAIWQRLDGIRTLGQVTDDLNREFEAQRSVIEQDVIGLMDELVKRRIVQVK